MNTYGARAELRSTDVALVHKLCPRGRPSYAESKTAGGNV